MRKSSGSCSHYLFFKRSVALASALVAVFAASSPGAHAAELSGVKVPESVTVQKKPLALNGLGMRQVTIFHVNVYVGALYAEHPSHDPVALLRSPDLKRIEMIFVRDVHGSDISKAWDEALEKNCRENCEAMKPAYAKLKAYMADIQKGERIAFDFYPDHVDTTVKGKAEPAISTPGFSSLLLSTWLGDHPPNEDLKKGMLGLK